MGYGPRVAAVVGFSAGLLLVVVTLALEVAARGLPLRGGLVQLQVSSVAVWVVESLPFLLGLAGWGLARAAISTDPAAVVPSGGAVAARRTPEVAAAVPLALPGPPASGGPPALGAPPLAPPPVPPTKTATPAPVSRVPPARVSDTSRGDAPTPPTAVVRDPPPIPGGLRAKSTARPLTIQAQGQQAPEFVRQVRDQLDRISRLSRSKSVLLAVVGQQVRQPIDTVVGTAELLLEDGGADVPQLRRIADAGRRVLSIVDPIVDLARVETGQLTIFLDDVDLAQVFEEIRTATRAIVDDAGGALSLRVAPGARVVRGDHRRLRDVVLAILGYAFTADNHGTQVQVSAERHVGRRDQGVVIRARVVGVRIPEALFDGTIDVYLTASSARGAVAIAVARQLVELMGGHVEITHTGGDTCVDVVLRSAAKGVELRPRSTVPLNERLAGLRMIVADGGPQGLSVARRLHKTGVEVVHVSDPDSVRAGWIEQRADVVIADVGIEGLWAELEHICGDGGEVIVTSLDEGDVEPALHLGVTAFLTKPYELDLLVATLERCIEP